MPCCFISLIKSYRILILKQQLALATIAKEKDIGKEQEEIRTIARFAMEVDINHKTNNAELEIDRKANYEYIQSKLKIFKQSGKK